jgi:hypothetical protein
MRIVEATKADGEQPVVATVTRRESSKASMLAFYHLARTRTKGQEKTDFNFFASEAHAEHPDF